MVDHLLKGTQDGIIKMVQIRAIRWPYAGAVLRLGEGAQPLPPSSWLGTRFLQVFPFFITDIVFVMT